MSRAPRPFVLAVSMRPLDATTTLFFRHLERLQPGAVRVVEYGTRGMAGLMGKAAAIVLVRGLFEFDAVVRYARTLGVPLYYFLDDHFIVLREQGESGAEYVARYSAENVRAVLAGFSGVLLATPALRDDVERRALHHRLFLFPPVVDAEALGAARARVGGVTVAFFGGRHLHGQLHHRIVPALRRVARQAPLRLIAVGVPEAIPESDGFTVVQHPYDDSYERGVRALAAEGVDLLVHPVAEGLANNAFKNPHALLTACALGAVPVVSNAPPYRALVGEGVARLCDDTEESWCQTIGSLATDATRRTAIGKRLAAYCTRCFGGSENRRVLDAMTGPHVSPGWMQVQSRVAVAWGFMAAILARRAATRVARLANPRAGAAAA